MINLGDTIFLRHEWIVTREGNTKLYYLARDRRWCLKSGNGIIWADSLDLLTDYLPFRIIDGITPENLALYEGLFNACKKFPFIIDWHYHSRLMPCAMARNIYREKKDPSYKHMGFSSARVWFVSDGVITLKGIRTVSELYWLLRTLRGLNRGKRIESE
ncbi:MAG: hypothetical protein D6732_08020 [Methanobacteriota archaeon]|nr:MAG: hypothetical protein D6732_08020 [Euryarchaeota archaeon]